MIIIIILIKTKPSKSKHLFFLSLVYEFHHDVFVFLSSSKRSFNMFGKMVVDSDFQGAKNMLRLLTFWLLYLEQKHLKNPGEIPTLLYT